MSDDQKVVVTPEPVQVKAQNITIVVRQMKMDDPGAMPRFRKLLSIKRAFGDFEHAQPEDVDEAYQFLSEYIVTPSSPAEKRALLDRITMDEVMMIFSAIQKGATVPPVSGGA
jgi:hypothetical protein